MNVLSIDTASPDASVALAVGGRIFEEALPAERRASEELLPALRRVVEASGIALGDCDRIAVCAGPGSFTGVRVGLATAWGISRAAGVPLETVSTLEALAETARGRSRRVLAALEAGRGEIVCGEYALPENARAASSEESVRVSPERARELASELGAVLVALPLDLASAGRPAGEDPGPTRPRPAAALALAVAAWPGETASSLAAIYSRPSAAEEKRGVAP